ncbi:hypothetical protein ElyMa_003553100 [Elysia marginata]|uniref:Uncharacterized protein n=1 Tax=Elysia marginata TaxID=1093978 RepID=A0AAV4ELF8_9GAST|nr:hypothetical protein ElyMa_003553100 [Elysia marginata]
MCVGNLSQELNVDLPKQDSNPMPLDSKAEGLPLERNATDQRPLYGRMVPVFAYDKCKTTFSGKSSLNDSVLYIKGGERENGEDRWETRDGGQIQDSETQTGKKTGVV